LEGAPFVQEETAAQAMESASGMRAFLDAIIWSSREGSRRRRYAAAWVKGQNE
jgi:hypothetical protein